MEQSKQSFWQTTKRFLSPIKSSKVNFSLTIVCGILWWLFATYIVIFLKDITNAIQGWDRNQVVFYSTIWLITITSRFIITIFYKVFPLRFFRDIHADIYKTYITKYFKGNNNIIEKIGVWRMISITQKWIIARYELFAAISRESAGRVFTTIFIFYKIGKINIWVMLVWILIFIFCVWWIYITYPKSLFWRKKWKHIDTETDRLKVLHIMNKFEIFQNNKMAEEINKVLEKINERYTYKVKEKIRQWISYDGVQYITNIVLLATAFYLAYSIFHSRLNLWDFVLFTGFAWLLGNQIQTLMDVARKFAEQYIHIEKMEEMFDKIHDTTNNDEDKKTFHFKNWDISIHKISFVYDKNPVFQDFSLKIKGATKTAFVGESWWGKTTLVKLLAGYIRPDQWEIEIDGQKLSKIKLTDYYQHVGYLTQEPSVFDWTIYENLIYALDTQPPKEELEKIIKLSKCEFIREFEKWLETEIGERWVRLSWWQKQRLAIAKIMLKNPNIILLDEPTSALDSFNEELISIALHNLFKWKTVIVVAHRLQTVKQADRILLLEQGKILEEWTHKELVKMNGKYKRMLDLQSWF